MNSVFEYFDEEYIGDVVFLTREDAEKRLNQTEEN